MRHLFLNFVLFLSFFTHHLSLGEQSLLLSPQHLPTNIPRADEPLSSYHLLWDPESLNAEDTKTIRTCGIVSSKHQLFEGKLSDYWAQELIGSDLVRAELESIPPPTNLLVAVFDRDIRGHNWKVRNLISDDGPWAILPELEEKIQLFTPIHSWRKKLDQIEGTERGMTTYSTISAQLKSTRNIPSFINHSISWGKGLEIYESFEKLSPPAVLINSAGNHFPMPVLPIANQAAENFNAILVGSLSPYGLSSSFSSEGEGVHILAPSDDYLTSATEEGDYGLFGGTSGAAPLVTGALAAFEWMSEQHPSAYEAKILLEKTAIKTLHSYEEPQRNGKGLLNAYKLIQVSKRLKEKCLGAKDPFCFQREIHNDENYYFPANRSLNAQLRRVYPSCAPADETVDETTDKPADREPPLTGKAEESGLEVFTDRALLAEELDLSPTGALPIALLNHEETEEFLEQPSCSDLQEAFLSLRQEVLLSPERRDLWESLSCIYREGGFSQNALLLEKIAQAAQLNDLDLESLSLEFVSTFLNPSSDLDSDTKSLMMSAFGSMGDSSKLAALLIHLLSSRGQTEALERLFHHEDSLLRQTLAFAIGESLPEYLSLLNLLKEDTMSNVKRSVALAAGKAGQRPGNSQEAFSLLWEMAGDADILTRMYIAESAGKIGGEEALLLLEELSKDKEAQVRVDVAKAAGELKALSLLWQMSEDQNTEVRMSVALSAKKLKAKDLWQKMCQDSVGEISSLSYICEREGEIKARAIIGRYCSYICEREGEMKRD